MKEQKDRYSAAWQQFLEAKRDMLAEYDRALTHARERSVRTHHGVVGEAAVRDWLGTFLPKRYGVTSGFVRSQDFEMAHQTPHHFDLIVYDQLEAPTLWIEANKDKSDSGRTRVIPAEHVRAIIEVKAAFSRRTVSDAIAKLSQLEPLMAGMDDKVERYPKFLTASAILAMFFFELRNDDATDIEALNLLRDTRYNRFFYGPVILRGEGLHPDDTALMERFQSEEPLKQVMSDGGLLHGGSVMTSTVEYHGRHLGAMLTWRDTNFSKFAFDLLALLNGTYRSGYISSGHGLDFKDKFPRH